MDSYYYILRYYIDTDFSEDERIAELAGFCKGSGIQEVMFFHNPEELFHGYECREEEDRWFTLARKVKSVLTDSGIRMSVNPWITTGHVSRGRRFGETGKDMRPMIGETGVPANITACPLDKNWQERICRFWARIASEISPAAIWVEDDWRLHNHDPEMGYGGCFCDEHLRMFAQRTGETVTRKELLEKILAPGEPHPWRSIWLDICRETMLEPARKLFAAVHEAAPGVRVGLMCSQPDVHSSEGRDWRGLKEAFSPDVPLCIRPHMQPYTEWYAFDIDPSTCRMTAAEFEPGEIEIYPELENSPRCGRYSKSGKFSVFQCVQAALCGARGITVNHYDMMGNGIALDLNFGKYLKSARKQLDEIVKLEIDDHLAMGVKVLFSPEIAGYVHCGDSKSVSSICQNNSAAWGHVFSKLGISHAFTRKVTGEEVYAVNGETLRAFSPDTVMELLSGGLILDAPSAEILLQMGLGGYIGISDCTWKTLNETGYAYEDIPDGGREVYGVDAPRMSASRCADSVLVMELLPGAEKLTGIKRYTKEELCPGAVYFTNSLGGKVMTLAYPLETAQFNVGYFNNFRRILWHRVLLERFNMTDIALGWDEPMQVFRHRGWCAFINTTHDDYEQIRFSAPGFSAGKVKVLDTDGRWQETELTAGDGDSLTCNMPLPSLGCLLIKTVAEV